MFKECFVLFVVFLFVKGVDPIINRGRVVEFPLFFGSLGEKEEDLSIILDRVSWINN